MNILLSILFYLYMSIGVFSLIEIIIDYKISNWWTRRKQKLQPLKPPFKTRIKDSINCLFKRLRRQKVSKKKVLDLTLHKEGMETVLHIKAAKEIEDYFRRASVKQCARKSGEKTETSGKWLSAEGEGLEFYVKNEQLSNKVSSYGPIMDNFGNGLMDGDKINLALLRLVGISDDEGITVKTDDLLGFEEMKSYVNLLGQWTKAFYEENLRDGDLSATVTFEV